MAGAVLGVGLLGAAAQGAAGSVRLPTEADALAYAPNSETILFGALGVETRLPGPVDDREQVSIGLALDGSVSRVTVAQRLTIFGVGDFSFKIPGPARNVQALPESASTPGLRKGALLWQGFAAGRKVLAAEVDLFPQQEAARLPVTFSLRMAVGGRPLTSTPATGPLEISLEIRNNSAVPIRIADADADPARVAPVLDTLRGLLASGRRIHPGRGGVPASVDTAGSVGSRQEAVEVPFRVEGELLFPPDSLTVTATDGAVIRTDTLGTHVGFDVHVGGGAPGSATIHLRGQATRLGLPRLQMSGEPAPPLAGTLRPPFGRSWARAAVTSPARLDGRRMLALALDTLWRVARLRQFDAYLGNPDVNGTSTSEYVFRLAPPVPRLGAPASAAPGTASPAVIATAILVIIILGVGLAVVWARS